MSAILIASSNHLFLLQHNSQRYWLNNQELDMRSFPEKRNLGKK
jgi:hypothetical protein